jgi:hypothetical protein
MAKLFQIKASDKNVLTIARLMGQDPTNVAHRLEVAIDTTDFEDKALFVDMLETEKGNMNGRTIHDIVEEFSTGMLNIFGIARKARIPSFDVRMTDALADVKINTVGDCPSCGEMDMEDTEECEELSDGDYYTPNTKRELWRCPCCGNEEWDW